MLIVYILLGILALFLAVILVRAAMFNPKPQQPVSEEAVSFDEGKAVEALAADLLTGRHDRKDTVRDEILHTVACKAAIKAGWKNDEAELLAVAKQVMAREDLKYCPHGRPICITLSKKQLEKQFKRT